VASLPPIVEQVRDLVERMAIDHELVRAEQAAALLGCDLRTLQRLFRAYVGVSPKWVIQRYRLHEAAQQLADGAVAGMTELALRLGYFDQAHFIRDFKAVVGRAPGEHARRFSRRTASASPTE
jgi:AraC-like DNA-binding protein